MTTHMVTINTIIPRQRCKKTASRPFLYFTNLFLLESLMVCILFTMGSSLTSALYHVYKVQLEIDPEN